MARSSKVQAGVWGIMLLVLAGAGAGYMIAAGLKWAEPSQGMLLVAAGGLGLVVVGAAAAVVVLVRRDSHGSTGSVGIGVSGAGVDRSAMILSEIHQHTMLSDAAKRVLYRDRELDLLRHAIEDDINRGHYSAGLTLCDDMANLFGNREEAEAFRSRIVQARAEHYEAEVRIAMEQFERATAGRDWAAAHREAARIRRLYPDSHYVQELDHRILTARDEHKRELETEFLAAAKREDVEQAMDLLRQLDRYLTQEEGAQLREVAAGVVSKHRENLGVQFKMAVNDHRWAEAARIGQAIITEFPNAKMSDEVRGMLDAIRTRASHAAVAAGGSSPR